MMRQSEPTDGQSSHHLEDKPAERYEIDAVKMLWRQFAFKARENGLETMYHALVKRDPILRSEDLFILQVDNEVQKDYIQPHLQSMINYIRENIKNYHFQIEMEMTKAEDQEKILISGKDKFAAIAKKQPNLQTLKDVFNLDIEY